MLELGAWPHPPRELYRAYLAQSDIFHRSLPAAPRVGRPGYGGLRSGEPDGNLAGLRHTSGCLAGALSRASLDER